MLHEKNGIVYPPASQQNNKKSEVCITQQERAGVSRLGQAAGWGGALLNKTLLRIVLYCSVGKTEGPEHLLRPFPYLMTTPASQVLHRYGQQGRRAEVHENQ